jgi:predicted AlkP superfamily phosphohydrolase/phosphomutase
LGIFDFANKRLGVDRLDFVNSTYFEDKPIWEILGGAGRRVAVFNVPVTFPPSSLNGVMVTGIMTPSTEAEFTFPPGLGEKVLRKFKEYTFDIERSRLTHKEAFQQQQRITRIHRQVVQWLWSRGEYDLFIAVLMAVDRMQHLFWTTPTLQLDHPDARAVLHTYQVMDQWLEEWLEQLSPEDHLFVISDHGGQFCKGRFHINEWLLGNGYLYLRGPSPGKARADQRLLHLVRKRIAKSKMAPYIRRLFPKLIHRFPSHYLDLSQVEDLGQIIDWTKTRAYALSAGRIYLNVQGRDKAGIVKPGDEHEALREELVVNLSKLTHPITGRSLVAQIFKREEIYDGRNVDSAPDLLMVLEKQRWGTDTRVGFGTNRLFSLYGHDYKDIAGTHSMDGILLASGPFIREGVELKGTRLIDITPTILHLLGFEVPEDMDGVVLQEMLKLESEPASRPVRFGLPALREVESEEDVNETVVQRLKALGYLD